MSNDMKTIMEAWDRFTEQEGEQVVLRPPKSRVTRGKLKEPEEEEEKSDPLKYTPDREKRKEDLLAPLKQKAQDKKNSAFAQAVLKSLGGKSGTVFAGDAEGRKGVLDAVEGGYEKVEDFEDAMALLNKIPTVNIKKPEDIPEEVMPVIINLISTLSAVGMFRALKAGAIRASLIQRFPHYKNTIINAFKRKAGMKAVPFLIAPKLPPLQLTMYGFLSAAAKLFADEFLMWFLGSATGMELEEETKE